tara:strand:- start:137 stop:466 length:330 start_codon:yes stop_codon:yes gene_type:complete
MFNLFLIIHAILAIILICSILLQRSDGGALGGLGGGSSNFSGMLEGRRSADFLTKLTTVVGALFLANSLFLAILTKSKNESSVIKSNEIQEMAIPDKPENDSAIIPDTE